MDLETQKMKAQGGGGGGGKREEGCRVHRSTQLKGSNSKQALSAVRRASERERGREREREREAMSSFLFSSCILVSLVLSSPLESLG